MKRKLLLFFYALCCFSLGNTQVVINEIYGAGGNGGANWPYDYVKLYNNGDADVSLNGWSLQYAAARVGSEWTGILNLNGTIRAKSFYLIGLSGSASYTQAHNIDASGSINLSGTAGRVALVNSTTKLPVSCPTSGFVDLVSFGTANCTTGQATGPNTTNAIKRIPDGTGSFQQVTPAPVILVEDKTVSVSAVSDLIVPGQDGKFEITLSEAAPAGGVTVNYTLSGTAILNTDYSDAQNGTLSISTGETTGEIVLQVIDGIVPTSEKTITITLQNIDDLDFEIDEATASIVMKAFENVLSFDFNNCSGTPGSGFTIVNTTGSQNWACSNFGRNGSGGVDINGFVSGAAQTNESWLISPVLDLSAVSNIPALNFYSRGEFSGPKLKLYISTDYSGSDSPAAATWTELTQAQFPTPSGSANQNWVQSGDISLLAYKNQPNVRIAFVYTSSAAEGAARWTVDDISITGVSGILSVSPLSLNFGEVSEGTTSASQQVSIQSVSATEDFTVTAPAGYEVSLDGTTYTSSLTITSATANAGTQMYVRFAPATKALSITGNITVANTDLSSSIAVAGSSYPKSETLDIVTYNLSFFGSNANNNATPQQVTTQVNNITTVVNRLNVDVIGFQEMSNDDALNTLMANLPGYAQVTAPRWSYSFNAPDPNFPPQKIGFIYNSNTLALSADEPPRVMFEKIYDDARNDVPGHPILNYPTGTPSSFWGSGRLPFMVTFETKINGVTEKIRMVVLHAKSGSATADYNRRVYDVQVLYDSLNTHYANDKVVVLGDYNDKLNGSIASGNVSSYSPFLNDANYYPLSLAAENAGKFSFPSSSSMIDHIMVSNEMNDWYIANSTDVEDPRSYISPYNATTASDHLPVMARFSVTPQNPLPVTFIHVQAIGKEKTVAVEWITASEHNNAYFEIERSEDGVHFETIGTLAGNGTTSNTHHYRFDDLAPLEGINYYRIKQVDIDGQFTYSQTVTVTIIKINGKEIKIIPNPVQSVIRLQLPDNEKYGLTVYNTAGQLVLQSNGYTTELNTYLNKNINRLKPGVYIIQVKDAVKTMNTRFVKE